MNPKERVHPVYPPPAGWLHSILRMAGGGGPDTGSTYSPQVAFIYLFNLVVGTGALALPSVLVSGGWYLGAVFLLLVACLSYIGVTFMIESMAAANALLFLERKTAEETEGLIAGAPFLGEDHTPFEIVKRCELGQMAEMFFSQWGQILFYAALILYLLGDAAIYCTFIPRSLVGFAYGDKPPAWAFDLFLALFLILIVPFCFFDFQKTKPLQIATMAIRNAALLTIIVLSLALVAKEGPSTKGVPSFQLQALPNLFGGAVYAFMCHHSLPGIITPMREKNLIPRVITGAFVAIFILYLLLFLACGVAFGVRADDPITFNFPPEKYGWMGDALFLFPVFTLASNFPMLTITLRNNLDTLLHLVFPKGGTFGGTTPRRHQEHAAAGGQLDALFGSRATRRRVLVTLLTVGPPIVICVVAEHIGLDVNSLVGLTGAYAGAAVMFIIPACLVHCSRRLLSAQIPAGHEAGALSPSDCHPLNIHASPFRGRNWVISLIVMAILAILFISYEQYEKSVSGPTR